MVDLDKSAVGPDDISNMYIGPKMPTPGEVRTLNSGSWKGHRLDRLVVDDVVHGVVTARVYTERLRYEFENDLGETVTESSVAELKITGMVKGRFIPEPHILSVQERSVTAA